MDSLANLRPIPKQDWKVRVRVSRFWRRILGNDEINGIGFIVVDENVSNLHKIKVFKISTIFNIIVITSYNGTCP